MRSRLCSETKPRHRIADVNHKRDSQAAGSPRCRKRSGGQSAHRLGIPQSRWGQIGKGFPDDTENPSRTSCTLFRRVVSIPEFDGAGALDAATFISASGADDMTSESVSHQGLAAPALPLSGGPAIAPAFLIALARPFDYAIR